MFVFLNEYLDIQHQQKIKEKDIEIHSLLPIADNQHLNKDRTNVLFFDDYIVGIGNKDKYIEIRRFNSIVREGFKKVLTPIELCEKYPNIKDSNLNLFSFETNNDVEIATYKKDVIHLLTTTTRKEVSCIKNLIISILENEFY